VTTLANVPASKAMESDQLTELQREVLDVLLDDSEPTWILERELEGQGIDRATLEALLAELEVAGVVSRTREESGNPAMPYPDPENWWCLTELGRRLVGPT
jgi:hypothetical protein